MSLRRCSVNVTCNTEALLLLLLLAACRCWCFRLTKSLTFVFYANCGKWHCTSTGLHQNQSIVCAVGQRWWPMCQCFLEFYTARSSPFFELTFIHHLTYFGYCSTACLVPICQSASQSITFVYSMRLLWLKCYVNKSDWKLICKQTNNPANKRTTWWM